MEMSFEHLRKRGAPGAPSITLGLRNPRDEYAGLDRLDRPELDDGDGDSIPSAPETRRRVA